MGRVFDAMRRHSATDNGNAAESNTKYQSTVTKASSSYRVAFRGTDRGTAVERFLDHVRLTGRRCEVQRPLRTLRMYPAGRHSPAE